MNYRPRPGMSALSLLLLVWTSSTPPSNVREQVWRHRNLGKAYYENPVTQIKAVDEFKEALTLAPESTRDRVNLGLALLRVGKTDEGMAELLKAQKEDPSIPHTWFNLGIAYKKQFKHQDAIEQLQGMLKLVPNEPSTHYNLGIEFKLTGKPDLALPQFIAAAKLNPIFAAPHFQLYNAYRELGRKEDAARELDSFNEIKRSKAGAAIQEDPDWSYYSEIYDVVDMDQELDKAVPRLEFQAKKVAAEMDPASAGLAVLDFDGDGTPDLIAWSDNGVLLLKHGTIPVTDSGLENLKGVVSIAPGDFNNDGLPDLAILTHTGALLYVNHGGKFAPYPAKLPTGSFNKAVWLDYDHDYDLDLLLLGSKSVLLRNDGAAGFSDQTEHFPFVAGEITDAVAFDIVPDNNESDLAAVCSDGTLVIYRDRLLGHYEAQRSSLRLAHGSSLQARDINNDGWTDLIAGSPGGLRLLLNDHGKLVEGSAISSAQGSVALADLTNHGMPDLVVDDAVYRNQGKARFGPASARPLPKTVALVEADFDGDGRTDLAGVLSDGSLELFKNGTATTNHWVRVRLEGVKNLKLPEGAVVEVKAGAWYQKRTYAGTPLVFGLRNYSEVDTVRVTWPNGMVQNETKQAVAQTASYKEKPRLSGSCPMIFAWNGTRFEFVTDVLGVAPLGASSGDGNYFPVNHREYVQIPEGRMRARDGHYEIRITEELREVSYLDQVLLMAVDHKASEDLFINDKFKGPPFPTFHLYGVGQRSYPIRAHDEDGRDVLPRLISSDGRYADSFRRNTAGVAQLHSLYLSFGNVAADNAAALVLNGWVDWADGSTFRGASQENKEGLTFPYLQVKNSRGQWQTVVTDMGIPSGKPKTIVVDLTGKFLSPSREIRIVTNLCVYWDEIFLTEKAAPPRARMTSLAPSMADLRYRGFSTPTIDPQRTQPEQFDYERWSATTGWNPTPGLYTRFGEVRQLLEHVDDNLVIMGSGDELRLLFDALSLPPLPKGWKRDFLLRVDGWAKDADANTAFARSVEPLPFHGMHSYPYPVSQHFPDDKAHRQYRTQFNTREAVSNLEVLRP
jgi:FG-GAP-like repeat/ASPIC and UnbV